MLQFVHRHDHSIVYTHRKPTAKDFATYWDAFAFGGGRDNLIAQANLTIACRETPDESALKELLNAEWSSLPTVAYASILESSGMFAFGKSANSFFGERINIEDLASEDVVSPHLPRLKQCGADLDMITTWASVRNVKATRVLIALPDSIGGYYYGRVPSLDDRINAQRIHNAPSTESEHGPFAAMCRLMIDCCLFCAPTPVVSLIDQWPGSVISIGQAVRELGHDSFVIEQKKSNP